MPILYLNFLFTFVLGALMAKYDIVSKCKIKAALCLLLLLVVVRVCIDTGIVQPLYATAFVVLFVRIKRWPWFDGFLYEMGRRSTSMWFVHTYFCVYLFRDFIYSFRYPLLIFLVLLVLSYLTAVVIDWLYAKVLTTLRLK